MNFEYGASSSSRITFSYYKFCALLEPTLLQKRFRERSQLFRYREFILPQSSLKELASEQLANEMDEQWAHHSSFSVSFSSAHPSIKMRGVNKKVQDNQPHQPQNLQDDAYLTGLSKKEIERRQKIGAANKGKVPWTKGRKWSEEHKKLIRQRTAEALRDPKVMSC
uniref:Nuclease associated modular domain-containing protein n=1 Tax=Arundo donax TaxID=35708 RepID=A0A0A9CHG4_ARUDO